MWSDLSDIWKESFSLAWESFNKNTIPIGAVIVDSQDNIIAWGRNRIYDESSKNFKYVCKPLMNTLEIITE
ncbi:hypothetical protein G9F72_014160 [Clostridium estertheticum]|uniref:hypothetical protein n=1 Tax=Clostridium estertheticum TaxID=238834 RepID=UPI0013E92C0B|nr:hypothetical protein [Clostridium estertheticum]MBZ9687471.1 hypothetical protein [Clostridium estertheticum]